MNLFSLFTQGLLLGFGAALPLGPINILIMNEALKSYKNALLIGLGAMSADLTYLFIIFYGLAPYLQETVVLKSFSLFGGLFLLYLSYLIFKGRNRAVQREKTSQKNHTLMHYFKGYILTLLNPYTIFFWLSITTYSLSSGSIFLVVCGMIVAILLWITLMPLFVYKKRALISKNIASKIAIVSAIIISLFALALLMKFFDLTFIEFLKY